MSIVIKHSIFDCDKTQWNACVPDNHPFLRYEFYQALEESECLGAKSGWLPFYLCGDGVILPIYLKNHSYGEYIFDWAWAQAYEKSGVPYYPKLTAALPHTPVSAPKFITRRPSIDVSPFMRAITEFGTQYKCSSTHFLFSDHLDLKKYGYLSRHSLQYHWHNHDFDSFDDFLGTLRKDKRKAFKKERKSIDLEIVEKRGDQITAAEAELMADLYFSTIEKKWSHAYLNRVFFQRWFELQKSQMVMFLAYEDQKPLAAALHLLSDTRLFGRYWGSFKDVPFLHFELCYYRAIDFAIKQRLQIVEAGAQGEHKLLRGFVPTIISSLHQIEHPGFRTAIAEFLQQEKDHLHNLMPQLNQLLPFKRA